MVEFGKPYLKRVNEDGFTVVLEGYAQSVIQKTSSSSFNTYDLPSVFYAVKKLPEYNN